MQRRAQGDDAAERARVRAPGPVQPVAGPARAVHEAAGTDGGAAVRRAAGGGGPLRPAEVAQLQRALGNRVVGALLQRMTGGAPAGIPGGSGNGERDEEDDAVQRVEATPAAAAAPAPANRTGMPDGLKQGVEALSGVSLDDVRVHYDSPRPARVQALAYAQGTEIHLASGQEKHLPHEAWHVVQQKQGRVQPTLDVAGTAVNDDPGLEREADEMGRRAAG